MFKAIPKPDTAKVLRELKPFQRDTVDHVFTRMYEREPSARRFLIADEVGLGKTIVARGLIARLIDRFWDNASHRIDIVYICSNGSIARQNLNKLNFLQKSEYPIPDRITMLPQVLKDLETQRLNLVSFTPGTSFNLGSSEGRAHERALLYWLLPESWRSAAPDQAVATLMGSVQSVHRFKQYVDAYEGSAVNESIRASFEASLDRQPELKSEFERVRSSVGKQGQLSDADRWARAKLVGDLRSVLARICVEKLEPDLVILDEFQRFKDLLHGEDPASRLARHLFQYDGARVLLLSATPYKMYTLHDETDDDHYKDFAKTVTFLRGGDESGLDLKATIDGYRQAIYGWTPGDGDAVRAARVRVEELLQGVMVRTERLASSEDRNGMLVEVAPDGLSVKPRDLHQFTRLQQTARLIGYGDVIEFWKSAPYLLNFMEDYDLKKRFVHAVAGDDTSRQLAGVLADDRGCLLELDDIEAYEEIDPGNARIRSLLRATVGRGTAGMLWVPPTLPYYELEGAFAAPPTSRFTKTLVFSAWQVVPKAVASLVTYEAERYLVTAGGAPAFANTPEARKRESRLLRFARSRGRLTGMPLAALMYPSETLADIGDPLEIARELRKTRGETPTLDAVLAVARERIATRLSQFISLSEGVGDESWYWAGPLLMDLAGHGAATEKWFAQRDLAAKWTGAEPEAADDQEPPPAAEQAGEQPDAWQEHVEEFRSLIRAHRQGRVEMQRPPDDLLDILALLAVAGPANVALRALRRLGPTATADAVDLRNAAAQVAAATRSPFNDPAVTTFLRTVASGDYWRIVLNYFAQGCFQSVLDEYVHLLGDCGGRRGKKPTDFVKPILEALTLFSAIMTVDRIDVDAERGRVSMTGPHQRKRLRTSYAARFGAQKGEDAGGMERNRRLQGAFNSPFWPFVLCSTSIGQEGLDFHYYCHAVVHWNLPSNPVDLEQREGRVHRYKGHAVRKNVVQQFGLPETSRPSSDPWPDLFHRAADETSGRDDGGLTPYWLYPLVGGAHIERHVPAVPLSLDRARADSLKRSLAVYRMAFGQARQEDVVAFLQRFPPDQLKAASDDLRINLSPKRRDTPEALEAPEAPAPTTEEDVDPVWSNTPDEPPDVHFGAIEELLDAFKSLAPPQTAERGARSMSDGSALKDLLDAFAALTDTPRRADPTESGPVSTTASVGLVESLLDAFVAVPRAPTADPIDDVRPRLQDLLDRFAAMTTTSPSPFER